MGTDTARRSVSGNQNSMKPAIARTNTKERSSLPGTSIAASLGIVTRQVIPNGEAIVGMSLARIPASSLLSVPSSRSPAAPSSSRLRRILIRLEPSGRDELGLGTSRYLPAVTTRSQQPMGSVPANWVESLKRAGSGMRSPSNLTGAKSGCSSSFPSITSFLDTAILRKIRENVYFSLTAFHQLPHNMQARRLLLAQLVVWPKYYFSRDAARSEWMYTLRPASRRHWRSRWQRPPNLIGCPTTY